ncbi:MAG: signal peptide peptidase SppA, partial [Pacificimonas sp.]
MPSPYMPPMGEAGRRSKIMAMVKSFWRFLVGVKDFLVLLLMLLIFTAIVTARSIGGDEEPGTTTGALSIDLSGFLVTQAQDVDPFALFAGPAPMGEIETRALIETIDAARGDEDIEMLVLDMDGFFGGGQADIQAVAGAVAAFRADGKPVVTYASAYFDDSWLIAAHADEVWLNPLGAVFIGGPGGSNLYFGEALERLKVDVNVFKVGTYKSAVEPYILSEASEPAKRVRQALADDMWNIWLQDAEAARPGANVPGYIASLGDTVRSAGGDFAEAALAAGLVDRIGTRVDFGRVVAESVGVDDESVPGSYLSVAYDDYDAGGLDLGGDSVGIVYVAGDIVDGEAPAGTAGGATIAALIERAVADEDVKALVVRVDSGGGSVTASEDIRQALVTAREEGLPVIASFGPVAASGGYWLATAADQIVAQPSTITGSIGVFAVIPTFQKALGEIGLNADGVETTPFSGAPDILGGLNVETEDMLQLSVEDIYRRFIGLVATARKLTPERVDEIGQGRVWSGAAARQLGLVDSFGTLDDAIALAEAAAGYDVGDLRRIDVEEQPSLPMQLLEEFFVGEEAPTVRGGTPAD